jgi:hypothetical protein
MTDHVATRKFILAGNATLTLRSMKTQTRYTFKIQKADDREMWFVKTLVGQDNTSDYAYLGIIKANGQFDVTLKSKHMIEAPQFKAFKFMWDRLPQGIANNLEIWHEGRCGRCNRLLTVPESIASGFGPECVQMV